jgi:hypothetical protein
MKDGASVKQESSLIKGNFVTDGETFVFRLAGTPISGIGKSATAAFEDLVRVSGDAAPLADRLRELARDQEDEKVRATVIRMAMVGLIVLGVVGGALFGAAAIFPRVVADTSELTIRQLSRWVQDMPIEKQEELSRAIARIMALGQPKNTGNPRTDGNR